MKRELLDELKKPLTVLSRPGKGNKTFSYVPSREIIDRMNTVFAGEWSTEVMKEYITNDCVTVHARVHVTDSASGRVFFQDGYGSRQIYTGDKTDMGNVFKSALSKAISNACKRWGVGLAEEDSEENGTSYKSSNNRSFDSSFGGFSPPETRVAPMPEDFSFGTSVPKPEAPLSNGFGMPDQKAVPVKDEGFFPFPFGGNGVSEPPLKTLSEEKTKLPPVPPPSMGLESIGGEAVAVEDAINDIQLTALTTILNHKGIEYEDLFRQAFKHYGLQMPEAIPQKEKLKYQEAVKLVSFGSSLKPRTNSH